MFNKFNGYNSELKGYGFLKNLVLVFSVLPIFYHIYSLYSFSTSENNKVVESYFLYDKNVIFYISIAFIIFISYMYLLNFRYVKENSASTFPFIIDFSTSVFFILSDSLDKSLIVLLIISGIGLLVALRFRRLNGITSQIV